MSWLPYRSLVPTGLLLSASCLAGNTHGPSSDDRRAPKGVTSAADTIAVESDAYLGPDGDDYWKGTTDSLVVDGVRSTRILIRANQAAIEEAIGNGTLVNATLELTVQSAGASWPTGGATVDAHRVLQHWTEAEVTWVCADGHEGWDMSTGSGSIWHAAHTARTTITNGETGVVRLNVTADVAAFLSAPPSNHGWLIKRTSEGVGEPGRIAFASRETTPQPRLIIEVESDTTRPAVPLAAVPPYDTTRLVVAPSGQQRYFRTLLGVQFDDSTSGATIRGVFTRYNATIVGGERSDPAHQNPAYYVQIPDPGSNYNDFATLVTTLAAEPGVHRVFRIALDTHVRYFARHPDDGQPNGRAGWTTMGASSHTRAWLAVRATLAWGCENGRYGTQARLGVIDALFEPGHADLENSQVFFDQPRVGEALDLGQITDAYFNEVRFRSHGMAVLGIAAATGDNGEGVAGMVWGGDLSLYATVRGQREWPLNWGKRYEQIFTSAIERGVRVMVASTVAGQESNVDITDRIRLHMRRYLEAGLGSILVLPVGDDGESLTIGRFATESGHGATAFQRAAAQLHDSLPGHIIFVHGTDESGIHAAGSNLIVDPGRRSIAAPSSGITSLARVADAGSSGILGYEGGTSLAAPFVAGLAAQLLAMDPTLTASRVKDLILDGASAPGVPRRNPVNGDPVPPTEVLLGTGIYRLDAYGSLSLLSRTRASTPICGVEVSAPDSRSQTELEIHRDSPQRFPAAASGRVSVAQGGRRLALGNATLDTTFVYSHTGQLLDVLPGVYQRFYTEKDTVDLQFYMQHLGGFDRDGTRVRRTGPSDLVDWFDPAERARGTATRWFDGGVLPSPDGQWIVLWANYDMTAQCSNQPNLYAHYRILLVPLGSPGFTALHANVRQGGGQSCTPQGDPADQFENFSAAWRPTADSLVLAFPRFNTAGQLLESRLEIRAAVANSPAGTTGSASSFLNIWSIEPDGIRLRTVQSAGGASGCEFRRMLSSSPFTDLASEPGCVQFEDEVDRVLPMLRASRRIAARATATPRY